MTDFSSKNHAPATCTIFLRKIAPLLAISCLAQPAQAFCLCLKCASGLYTSYEAPSGSMKPTIEPGACVIAENGAPVDRGSIVVFRHPGQADIPFVKRLIGLPGDRVAVVGGQVILNGAPVPQTPGAPYVQVNRPEGPAASYPRCPGPTPQGAPCEIARLSETLPNGTGYDVLSLEEAGAFDTFAEVTVPPGHIFVMGDNRDNSADSRLPAEAGGIGFVPAANILGPVVKVSAP